MSELAPRQRQRDLHQSRHSRMLGEVLDLARLDHVTAAELVRLAVIEARAEKAAQRIIGRASVAYPPR